MSTIQSESLTPELAAEATSLILAHWNEVARNKELMVLDPDWGRYLLMQDAGKLIVLTARNEGRLVGYSISIIDKHLHYQGLTAAINDVIYLDPGLRGTVGLRLLAATEDEGRARGAQLMLWHAKPGTSLDKLMARRGYGVQDILYSTPL